MKNPGSTLGSWSKPKSGVWGEAGAFYKLASCAHLHTCTYLHVHTTFRLSVYLQNTLRYSTCRLTVVNLHA